MESRVAVLSIIVEDRNSVGEVNDILHQHSDYIIGRMGIPYRAKNLNLISIVMDGPQDAINSMSGRIGRLPGVSTKTAYSNVITKGEAVETAD